MGNGAKQGPCGKGVRGGGKSEYSLGRLPKGTPGVDAKQFKKQQPRNNSGQGNKKERYGAERGNGLLLTEKERNRS